VEFCFDFNRNQQIIRIVTTKVKTNVIKPNNSFNKVESFEKENPHAVIQIQILLLV